MQQADEKQQNQDEEKDQTHLKNTYPGFLRLETALKHQTSSDVKRLHSKEEKWKPAVLSLSTQSGLLSFSSSSTPGKMWKDRKRWVTTTLNCLFLLFLFPKKSFSAWERHDRRWIFPPPFLPRFPTLFSSSWRNYTLRALREVQVDFPRIDGQLYVFLSASGTDWVFA